MNNLSLRHAVMACITALCVVWLITGDGTRLEPLIMLIVLSMPRFETTSN